MTDKNILEEIQEARKDIKTDFYTMSVGEIAHLYKDEDIILNPAYQRLYRWNSEQKSNFIESLILGFPIPPLFVSQHESGTWDVVDGVQRISTVLQLLGLLKGHDPLVLRSCKYIPSLEGATWETLDLNVKRIIKRAKLSIQIILTDNSVTAQYEVFQRLNTGGLHLSDQEIRNCLIIMSDEDFYNKINTFKSNSDFIEMTPITDDKMKEEYRMELVIRYLVGKCNSINYRNHKLHQIHVRDLLDTESVNLISNDDFDLENELEHFGEVCKFLNNTLGPQTFRKYLLDKEEFEGRFSLQVFEAFLPGFASNFTRLNTISREQLTQCIIELSKDEIYIDATKRGQKAPIRYKMLVELSHKYFNAYEL